MPDRFLPTITNSSDDEDVQDDIQGPPSDTNGRFAEPTGPGPQSNPHDADHTGDLANCTRLIINGQILYIAANRTIYVDTNRYESTVYITDHADFPRESALRTQNHGVDTTAPTLKARIQRLRVQAPIYTSLSQTKVSGLKENQGRPKLSRRIASCRPQQLVVMKKAEALDLSYRGPILPPLHAESTQSPVPLSATAVVDQGIVLTLASMPSLRAEMLNILPIMQLKRV
ncbi:hypothetical protein PV04_01802 [Phialophora macrospora]|uniref:Uncharacterized protein n=1 Tax=Phialophora macrospora TaxID=1851006 RepID=A0A0D2D7Z0_9EURO|nr:hypothetical protein PV04_01802 [Phialophora macrospora]